MKCFAWVARGFLCFLTGLFAFLPLVPAAPVSLDTVRLMVHGWRQLSPRPLGSTPGDLVGSIRSVSNDAGTVVFYVASFVPEGYALVASDDRIEPIIAFSDSGHFDESMENPLFALAINDLPVRLAGVAIASRSDAEYENTVKWQEFCAVSLVRSSRLDDIDDVRVPPLMTTAWNQTTAGWSGGACYNYYTPPYQFGASSNYYCGCTQTAWAQIMHYFRWPQISIGAIVNTIRVDGVREQRSTLNRAYNWDLMVDAPDSSTPENQRQAIGALTYDIGVVNGASYTASGTSAGMSISDLKTHFSYTDAKYIAPTDASLASCISLAINVNLDAQRPVQLSIRRDGGGHAVVCDGYGYNASTLYHHINLGWGGSYDAWYQLPDVDTGYYDYDVLSSVIYNLYTNGTGEMVSGRVLDLMNNPLSGIDVILAGNGITNHATSNTNGIFAFDALPSNASFTLSGSAAGRFFESITVTTGRSIDYNRIGNKWGVDVMETNAPCELYITSTNQLVPSTVQSVAISGTAGDTVVGQIGWTNLLTMAGGSFAAALTWTQSVALAVGTNPVIVTGTNSMGVSASDTVTVVRAGLPVITVDVPVSPVEYAVTQQVFSGTANSYVTTMSWTNEGAQQGGSIASATNWSSVIPLLQGTNIITIQGMNDAGETAISVPQTVIRRDQNPIMTITPLTVSAVAFPGTTNTVTSSFQVSNTGGKELSYTIDFTTNDWLQSISSLTGTLTHATTKTHIITCDPSGLEKGIYTNAMPVIADSPATNASQIVSMRFIIREARGNATIFQLLLSD